MADYDQFSVSVVTPGTPVQVSAVDRIVNSFEVIAFPGNTAGVGWGKSGVSMSRCVRLGPGDLRTYGARKGGYNLRYYWIDADVGSEGVTVIPS